MRLNHLELNGLPLHRHSHATGATATAGELIAFKGHHTLLVTIDVDLAVHDVGGG